VTHFLYLVRHGEADPHDGPLSQAGERQAQLTGQRLKDVPFSGIYHGPLPRAAQTAGLIAASLPVFRYAPVTWPGITSPSPPIRATFRRALRASSPGSRRLNLRTGPNWPPQRSSDSPGRAASRRTHMS
jgi:broad specificity phosphatase PhoE